VKKDFRNEKAGPPQTPPKTPGSPVLQHVSRFIKTIQLLRSSRKILEKRFEEQNAVLAQAKQAFHAEIDARQKAEAENRLLLKIIRAIGEARDFPSALSLALEKMCETGGWVYGEAWTPRPEGSVLECNPAWHRDSDALETFRKLSESFTFAPGDGPVGRVWSTKQPEWIEDISVGPVEKHPRADIAAEAGLKAALAVPVLAGEQVLAVLIFFTSESRQWNEWHVDMSLTVASQLGSMLERKQVEEAMRKAHEELETRVRERTAELTNANETLQAEIAERQRAEVSLRESEGRYRDFADATPVLIWQSGPDKLCTYFNKGWLEFTGRTMEEELGNGWTKGLHPEDFGSCLEKYIAAFDRLEPFLLEYRLRHRSGEYRWILDRGEPLYGYGGIFLGYVGGCIDIHDRKQAETARQLSESWLKSLIETTQDAVISIDRRGRIVLFNPSAERIFGYSKDEIQGQKVNLLMAEPYGTEHDSYISHYEGTGEAKAIGRIRTVEGRRKNGEVFPLELSVAQVTVSETEEIHYAAFIRDISDKTALQRRLMVNERLAAIGTAMSVFAHEIGNPLNGMFVNVQLLERNISKGEGAISEAINSGVKGLKNELTRLGHLLHDFRSVSRPDQYIFRRFSLAALVEEIYAVEAETLHQQGIRVEQDFPPDLPPVFADHDKLEQALLNLWKNACDAMPGGGTLSFKAGRSGDEVILEIKDTGIGIPKEVDIFEPFVTTKQTGTGLGLMIVRQIVSAHRGTVYYTSEQGKGTTFYLKLPMNPPVD
jgi:PAS domain S-box-containing protein